MDRNSFPDLGSIQSIEELLKIRATLPRVTAGHWLQAYKWQLAGKLRRLRMAQAGKIDPAAIRALVARAGDHCPLCRAAWCHKGGKAVLSLDHIKALANGGTNEAGNLRIICAGCNSKKSAS